MCQEFCPVYTCPEILGAETFDCCPESRRWIRCLSQGGSFDCSPAFTYTACADENVNSVYNVRISLFRSVFFS